MAEDWQLPPLRQGVPADAALVARRDTMHALAASQIVVAGTRIVEAAVGGVRCVEVTAPGADGARGTLLHLHGGGFRLGEARLWTGLASRLSAASGLAVMLPDYALAPEHPFPAALHEAAAVYRALRARGVPLVLGGDSAGGGLATALALHAHHAGLGDAAALLLFSPWLDLTVTAASFARAAATDAAFSREAALDGAAGYLCGIAPETPLASPLHAGSLAGLPPCWVCASASEVLVDDAVRLAARMAEAGRAVELVIRPGLPHVWPVVIPASPETEASIAAAARFLDRQLASPTA